MQTSEAKIDYNRDTIRARAKKKREEFHEWIQTLRTNNGCEDCGTHKGSLLHHHIDPDFKKYNVSQMSGCSLDALKAELKKCVVLCLLCHQDRHQALRSVKSESLLTMGEIRKAKEPLCSLPTSIYRI